MLGVHVDRATVTVTVAGQGTTTITATSERIRRDDASITVNPVPVATVTVSAPTTPMVVGGTQQLSAVTWRRQRNPLSGRLVTWVSSNTAVLTVSASGLVTAAGYGHGDDHGDERVGERDDARHHGQSSSSCNRNAVAISDDDGDRREHPAALGRDQDAAGNVLTGRTITWSSNNAAC